MTEVKGEYGSASWRVKGREYLGCCPKGCADGTKPFCAPAPLEVSGFWCAIVIVRRAQEKQP